MNTTKSQSSTLIKPEIVDGIELYVTDFECGMTQEALASFCGVKVGSIRSLMKAMEYGNTCSKPLNKFFGHSLYLAVKGENEAKLVRAQVCEAICKYYTFESKAKNVTALASYRKFGNLSVDAWIRDVTGHPRKPALTVIESVVQKLTHNVLYPV